MTDHPQQNGRLARGSAIAPVYHWLYNATHNFVTAALVAVGLLLAIAGLYGLVAYNVSRRTREIGIRMALGAGSSDVLRLVMGKGLVLVGMGTAIGLAMSFGVERLLNSVFNTGGVDIVVYIVVVPAMVVVTMLAAYVPARRASRIEPTQALRYE